MRTHIIATATLLLATIALGAVAWLIGDNLPGRLFGIAAMLAVMTMLFTGFILAVQILSNWMGPDESNTAEPQRPAAPPTSASASDNAPRTQTPSRRRAA